MMQHADQSAAQANELLSEEDEEESEQENSSEASSSEAESGSEDDDDDDEDDDEAALEKQRHVESDLRDLRRMLEDMDKVKLRLQFRLHSEREAKLADESREREMLEAQREQQAALERLRQQHEIEMLEAQRQQQELEVMELEQKYEQEAQQQPKPAQSIPKEVPTPRYMTSATQTDYGMAFMERMEHALEESTAVMHTEQTESPPRAAVSVSKPVRLSLYDLVKSSELKHTAKRPSIALSTRVAVPNTQAQGESAIVMPPPLDESENSTFFIRRESERNAAWKEDSFAAGECLPQGKDSIITSPSVANEQEQEEELFESFQSSAPRRAPRKAFRSSIDSNRATATAAPYTQGRSQRRSPFVWPAELLREDDEAKTETQREMDAIRALLF